jgi:chemotaxis protein MotB
MRHWKSLRRGAVLIAVTAVLLPACVTKSAYERLEANKNQEIAALQADRQTLERQRTDLQKQIQDLNAQRAGLEEQKAQLERESVGLQTKVGLLANDKETLEQDKAALEKQKTLLTQQQADLQKQIAALEQQKTELLASSQQTQSEYDTLVKNLTDEVQKGQLQVRRYKNMLTVDVAEQLFFDSGSANLKESGKEVLKKVGETLKGYDDKIVRVVGHTDNVPIAKSLQDKYASNWELSVARATTVVRFLQQVGVPPERLIASGRAQYAPVASNDTAQGRKKNRRIEITLIDRNLAQEVNQATN